MAPVVHPVTSVGGYDERVPPCLSSSTIRARNPNARHLRQTVLLPTTPFAYRSYVKRMDANRNAALKLSEVMDLGMDAHNPFAVSVKHLVCHPIDRAV